MSPITAVGAASPYAGKIAAMLPTAAEPRAASGPATARPPAPVAATSTVPTATDGRANCPAADARRVLAAAVRTNAARSGPKPAQATPPETPEAATAGAKGGAKALRTADPVPVPHPQIEREAIIARVVLTASGLPVMPEPASPARSAFAQALLALRAGIRRDGAANTPLADG